jgi:hypothetical protein
VKPPELKFRARFVVVKGKTVKYEDVPKTSLQGAVAAAKQFKRHSGVTCAMAEEWINGHWTLRERFPKPKHT